MSIDDWRVQIDELDAELLRLLNERARIALKVGDSKKQTGASLCDHTREREVIERLSAANEGPLDDRAIVELYRAIIHESRRIQNLAHHSSPESRTPRFSGAGNGSRRVIFREPAERSVKKRRPNSWVKKSRSYRGRASNLCSRQSTISPPTAFWPRSKTVWPDLYTRVTTCYWIASFLFRVKSSFRSITI